MADLSAGYKPKLTRVRRGLAVLHRNQVLVQDEIEASQPVNIVWNFHTKADIKINGNRAILTQGKQTLEARILTPPGELSLSSRPIRRLRRNSSRTCRT